MKILEFVAIRIVLFVMFAVGLTIVSIMLALHYYQHGKLPET